MNYQGDTALGSTIDVKFTSRQFSTGAPFTLAGSPAVAAYVGNSTTEITAGITLTTDFDGRTGLNNVRVVATSGNGFAADSDVKLVLTAGTVDGVSVVGEVVATFSIEKRSALRPSVAGRTLGVESDGDLTKVNTLDGHVAQTGDGYAVLNSGTHGNAALKTLLDAIDDYIDTEVQALLDRLTATRAGYLDKLNITGNVASSAEVTAIQNNTRVRVIVPAVMERPDSGDDPILYKLHLYLYDDIGNMEAPDSTPTLTAVNEEGTDRSADLGTVTAAGTGHYSVTYSVDDAHAIEQLLFEWTVVEAGATRLHGASTLIVDTTAVDFTSADRTKLDAVHAKLPSKSYLAGTSNSDGDVQIDESTGDFNATQQTRIQTQSAAAIAAYDPIRPTVAGRKIAVAAAGQAGVDWANVASQSTTVNLTGTSILASGLGAGGITSSTLAASAITAIQEGLALTGKTLIGSTGNDTTHVHLPTLTYGDDEINDHLLVIVDTSTSELHARWIEDWDGTSKLATVTTLPFTPEDVTDRYLLLATRRDVTGGGGGGLTAQETRDAMKLAPSAGSPAAGSIDKHLDDLVPSDPINISTEATNIVSEND